MIKGEATHQKMWNIWLAHWNKCFSFPFQIYTKPLNLYYYLRHFFYHNLSIFLFYSHFWSNFAFLTIMMVKKNTWFSEIYHTQLCKVMGIGQDFFTWKFFKFFPHHFKHSLQWIKSIKPSCFVTPHFFF